MRPTDHVLKIGARLDTREGHLVLLTWAPGAPMAEANAALGVDLLPEERAMAALLPPARASTWTAGRLALRVALRDLGLQAPAIVATARGAPTLPPGMAASISHKPGFAAALLQPDCTHHVGVDLERVVTKTIDVAPRIFTHAEQARLVGLDAAPRLERVLLGFSAKEALYKALDPFVQRYVSFTEVEVEIIAPDRVQFRLQLESEGGAFHTTGSYFVMNNTILTTASCRKTS